MPALARYLALTNTFSAGVTISVFLLGNWLSPFPTLLVAAVLVLSPAHVLFIATAACKPFDWCSLSTLLWVLALNAVLFSVVAAVTWLTWRHGQFARVGVIGLLVGVLAVWLRFWL